MSNFTLSGPVTAQEWQSGAHNIQADTEPQYNASHVPQPVPNYHSSNIYAPLPYQVNVNSHRTSLPSTQKQPWHNSNPFVVVPLSARVRKCKGCPFDFRDPLGPPFVGIVLQHKEKDCYRDKEGEIRVSREANHYYHCQLA